MKIRKKHTKEPTIIPERTEIKLPNPPIIEPEQIDVIVNVYPRITEWLNRKELTRTTRPMYDWIKHFEISWIYKQNRYVIHKGTFTEDMLDQVEEAVYCKDYELYLEKELDILWLSIDR